MTDVLGSSAGIEVEILTDTQVEVLDGTTTDVDVEVLLTGDGVSVIDIDTDVVEVLAGIKGDKGDRGPAGDSGNLSYEVTVAVASTIWATDHPLGYVPAGIQVQDQTGKFRTFVINILNNVHVEIEFAHPMIGTLILS